MTVKDVPADHNKNPERKKVTVHLPSNVFGHARRNIDQDELKKTYPYSELFYDTPQNYK